MERMDDIIRHTCRNVAIETLRTLTTKKPKTTGLRSGGESGAEYMHRLVNVQPDLCKEQLRLTDTALKELVDTFVTRRLLKDSKRVSVLVQVGMTLYILAKGASYRHVADTFKHCPTTVGKYFHRVVNALKILSFDVIRLHTPLDEVPSKIANSSMYFPYFQGCVGALDGTHIEAVLGEDQDVQFRGRKGVKTWNVLASCSFDELFTHVNAGWEGSVHDTTVWKDSLTQQGHCFPHPPQDKYYLVDSGYPNTRGYLAPYKDKSARYHMPNFRHGDPPTGIYEHFNYRHSSLRTTIERAFGILKTTWRILHIMPQVEDNFQVDIILATFTLHNIIRMHKLGIPIEAHDEVQGVADTDLFELQRKAHMNEVRDMIATAIMESIHENESEDNMDES